MWYRVAADAVLVVHLLFIGFVVGGVFLAWRWPLVIWVQLPAMVYGALIEFVGFTCPLTPLQNYLQHRAGEAGYSGGFISHYLIQWIYRPASPGESRSASDCSSCSSRRSDTGATCAGTGGPARPAGPKSGCDKAVRGQILVQSQVATSHSHSHSWVFRGHPAFDVVRPAGHAGWLECGTRLVRPNDLYWGGGAGRGDRTRARWGPAAAGSGA